MKQLITLLLLFTVCLCEGQSVPAESDTVLLADIKNESNLLSKTIYYFDGSDLPVSALLEKPFQKFIGTYPKFRVMPNMISNTLCLKLWLKNNTARDITGYIDPGIYFTKYSIYRIRQGSASLEDPGNTSSFKKITIEAGETAYFLVKIKPLKTELGSLAPVFFHADYLEKHTLNATRYKTDIQIFGLILSGVLFMMILFMLANFVTSRKLEFLYNALYSACMFILIYFNSTVERLTTPFNNFYYSYLDFFLLVTGTTFYISFTRKFLDTKNNYTLLDRILKYASGLFYCYWRSILF